METMFRDLRFAVRGLLRTPGFTAAAVLALALGIGATTAIFSVVHAILLRSLGWGEETRLVQEMCAYGQRISPRLQFQADPPFQDTYRDYAIYLETLMGENVEEGIQHFRERAERADPEADGTFPAEVLVNLLVRAKRPTEALAVARRYLKNVGTSRPSCPSIAELCRQTNDYLTLAEVARERIAAGERGAGVVEAR